MYNFRTNWCDHRPERSGPWNRYLERCLSHVVPGICARTVAHTCNVAQAQYQNSEGTRSVYLVMLSLFSFGILNWIKFNGNETQVFFIDTVGFLSPSFSGSCSVFGLGNTFVKISATFWDKGTYSNQILPFLSSSLSIWLNINMPGPFKQ